MSTTTTINGWTIPELSDVPNIETAIHPLANAIDARVIPIFTTTGARDSAITAPSQGQHAEVTGTGEHYRYNGSLWVSDTPRTKFKTANETVTSSAVLQNDDDLFLSVEANAYYFGILMINYTAGGGDFRSLWTFPSGTTGIRYYNGLRSGSATVNDDRAQVAAFTDTNQDVDGLGSSTPAYYMEHIFVDTGGSSGTLQFQWCQATSSGTSTVVRAGSVLQLWKIG